MLNIPKYALKESWSTKGQPWLPAGAQELCVGLAVGWEEKKHLLPKSSSSFSPPLGQECPEFALICVCLCLCPQH